MEITMKKYARVAAVGAFGVSVGVLGLYLLIAVGGSHTPRSGIDATNGVLVWIGAAIPAAAIIATHIAFAVQLLRHAKENQG
ncbi:MAG: hypothetical protein ABI877_08640 [Gemmatimonadaceae bacterium]